MQKFLTNLLLVLAIMAVLLFFSPLSSMLDFWEPATPEEAAPIEELPVATADVDLETSEEVGVDLTDPVIEPVADTDLGDAAAPEGVGEEAESEELPDAIETTEITDEPDSPETPE